MRRATYIEFERNGVNVEGGCLIVDRNTLYIKMMAPHEVCQTLTIDPDKEALTETEKGEEELFAYAETVMKDMYHTIKLIEREPEMFQRLYVNFEAMVSGQHIRYYKRVFHSETDRLYFLKDMEERIQESYYQLFDKYIVSTDRDILGLRDTLTPRFLRQVMKKVFNLE